MNARYYVPNTNRMLTPDTIVPDPTNPQTFNRYSYVNNNPINFSDPSGHNAVCNSDGSICSDGAYDDGTTYDIFSWVLPSFSGEWPFHSNEDLISMVGSEFEGADTMALQLTMIWLSNNPTGIDLDNALHSLAEIRGLELVDVRRQYDTYVALRERASAVGYLNGKGPVDTTLMQAHLDWWGSTEQLRYGQIVGDAFGIDAVFGALLNPTGGRVGPGDHSFLHWLSQNSEAVNYHGQVHDAGGYLYNYHNIGPGYTYANPNATESDRGQALSGQVSGLLFWWELLGD